MSRCAIFEGAFVTGGYRVELDGLRVACYPSLELAERIAQRIDVVLSLGAHPYHAVAAAVGSLMHDQADISGVDLDTEPRHDITMTTYSPMSTEFSYFAVCPGCDGSGTETLGPSLHGPEQLAPEIDVMCDRCQGENVIEVDGNGYEP